MVEIWRLMPSLDDPRFPPPGLLLSLGDGRAVEVTAEMLARAMCVGKDPNEIMRILRVQPAGAPKYEDAGTATRWEAEMSKAMAITQNLIQQAQEARDA